MSLLGIIAGVAVEETILDKTKKLKKSHDGYESLKGEK